MVEKSAATALSGSLFGAGLSEQVPSTGIFGTAKNVNKDSEPTTDTNKAALGVRKRSVADSNNPNADRATPSFGTDTVKAPFNPFIFSGMKGQDR